MNTTPSAVPARQPAIARLIEHHGGPTAFSAALGNKPVYQEVQRWKARGWASPAHILRIRNAGLLVDGITIEDLYSDRDDAREALRREQESSEAQHEGGVS